MDNDGSEEPSDGIYDRTRNSHSDRDDDDARDLNTAAASHDQDELSLV